MDRSNDLFGRTRLITEFSRAHRVRLVKEVADALIEGRQPSAEASMFVAGALTAWLSGGGDLVRDYLQLSRPRGSHRSLQSLLSLDEDSDGK